MPQPDLPSVKAFVVLPGRIPQHLIFRGVGLYQRPAGLVTPARSAHNLGQKYKGAFGGAVVVHIQRLIRRQDPHQRHIIKIQSLGHHLCSQKDRNFFLIKFLQHFFMLHAHRVCVHP